jgi:hypothetical protein
VEQRGGSHPRETARLVVCQRWAARGLLCPVGHLWVVSGPAAPAIHTMVDGFRKKVGESGNDIQEMTA